MARLIGLAPPTTRYRTTLVKHAFVLSVGVLNGGGCQEDPTQAESQSDEQFSGAGSPLVVRPGTSDAAVSRQHATYNDATTGQWRSDGKDEPADDTTNAPALFTQGSRDPEQDLGLMEVPTGTIESYLGPWGKVVLTGTVGTHRSTGKLTFYRPTGEVAPDWTVTAEQWRGGYASETTAWWHGPAGLFLASAADQTALRVETALESVSQVTLTPHGVHVLGARSAFNFGEGARTELCLRNGTGCGELRALDDVWWLVEVGEDGILAFADDYEAGRPALVEIDRTSGSRRRLAWLGSSAPYMPAPLTVPLVARDTRLIVLRFDSELGPTEVQVQRPDQDDEHADLPCVSIGATAWRCGGDQ